MLAGESAALVCFTAVVPIEVEAAKGTLDAGDAGYGALLTSWGIGMVLGSAIFARASSAPLGWLLFVGTVAIGGAYVGIGLSPTIAACVGSVLGGAGNGVVWVLLVSAVQQTIEGPFQVRVMAVFESIAAAMPGVGFMLGGVLAAAFSARVAYIAPGVAVLFLAVVGAVIGYRLFIRGSRPEADGATADQTTATSERSDAMRATV